MEKFTDKYLKLYLTLPDVFTTKQALRLAVGMGMSEASLYLLLRESNYYAKIKRGYYKKNENDISNDRD